MKDSAILRLPLMILAMVLFLGCERPASQVELEEPSAVPNELETLGFVPDKDTCIDSVTRNWHKSQRDELATPLEEVDPDGLTDRERFALLLVIHGNGGGITVYDCMVYWSEAITEDNADKRNEVYRDRCIGVIETDFNRQSESVIDIGNRGNWIDSYSLLQRPYLSLTVSERIALRSLIDVPECRRYYPQLFYGRWIPILDFI